MEIEVLNFFSLFFFFKQKTAYEIKECDWSSDVCSSDLAERTRFLRMQDAVTKTVFHPFGNKYCSNSPRFVLGIVDAVRSYDNTRWESVPNILEAMKPIQQKRDRKSVV